MNPDLVARVIPCLDVTNGRVVKGINFVDLRDAGDPVELAARYDAQGADELVFLDITASSDGRDTMIDVVSRTAEEVFIPFTVGGGIRELSDARALLRAGADKISVNTSAVQRPQVIADIADEFGSQCVVCAIDAKWDAATHQWMVFCTADAQLRNSMPLSGQLRQYRLVPVKFSSRQWIVMAREMVLILVLRARCLMQSESQSSLAVALARSVIYRTASLKVAQQACWRLQYFTLVSTPLVMRNAIWLRAAFAFAIRS